MDATAQIRSIRNDIYFTNLKIQEINEKINRLEVAKTNLMSDQNELGSYQHLRQQPELSNMTWQGNYANEFQDMRDKIGSEFTDILNLQSEILLDNILRAITQLRENSASLSSSINSKQYQISVLQRNK